MPLTNIFLWLSLLLVLLLGLQLVNSYYCAERAAFQRLASLKKNERQDRLPQTDYSHRKIYVNQVKTEFLTVGQVESCTGNNMVSFRLPSSQLTDISVQRKEAAISDCQSCA